jgi:hypothetical protein
VILPDDLPAVEITGDDNVDLFELTVQDIRWRILMANARFITGEITEDYRDTLVSFYLGLIDGE